METTSMENNNFERVIKLYGTTPIEEHFDILIKTIKTVIDKEITIKSMCRARELYIYEVKSRAQVSKVFLNIENTYATSDEKFVAVGDAGSFYEVGIVDKNFSKTKVHVITIHIPYYVHDTDILTLIPKKMLSDNKPEEAFTVDITLTRDEICFDIYNTINSKEDIITRKEILINNIILQTNMINEDIEEYNNNLEKVIGDIFDKRMNTVKLQKEIMDSLGIKVK